MLNLLTLKKILKAFWTLMIYNACIPHQLLLLSSQVLFQKVGDIAEILGIIEIDRLNLKLPILSKTTDEFLEIAPCKFYGNILNGYGNFCIAGHNFNNNEFFSNLKTLEIGNNIKLYNLNGDYIQYEIYNKFETDPSDLSYLNQNNLVKKITLITCNNQNKKRLIIQAKEK